VGSGGGKIELGHQELGQKEWTILVDLGGNVIKKERTGDKRGGGRNPGREPSTEKGSTLQSLEPKGKGNNYTKSLGV